MHWSHREQENKKRIIGLDFSFEDKSNIILKSIKNPLVELKRIITFHIAIEDKKQAYRFHMADDKKQRQQKRKCKKQN